MILYKYVSFGAGLKILETNKIGFSHLNDFNDPFESTAFGFDDNDVATKSTANNAFRNNFAKKYGVLSLTNNPLHPLMWAHYGCSHTGLAIGIDVNKAGFNQDSFVIKAKDGRMDYFPNELPNPYQLTTDMLSQVGNDDYFSLDGEYGEIFKRAFLYKQAVWAYEQEFRIVQNFHSSSLISFADKEYKNKSDKSSSQLWDCFIYNYRPLYLYHLPKDSIVKIYLGEKTQRQAKIEDNAFSFKEGRIQAYYRDRISGLLQFCRNQKIQVNRSQVNYKTWDLIEKKID